MDQRQDNGEDFTRGGKAAATIAALASALLLKPDSKSLVPIAS